MSIHQNLEQKMQDLKHHVKDMFVNVEQVLQLTRKSLEHFQHYSDEVRKYNQKIDDLELKIDEQSIALLVSERPYGMDLRYIFTTVKTVKDLERIGDECGNVMRAMRNLDNRQKSPLFADLKKLGEYAFCMFDYVKNEFLNEKFRKVRMQELVDLEKKVDDLEARTIKKTTIPQIVLIARGLERIGDLSINLEENLIYNQRGMDIRHGHFEEKL